MEHFLQVGIGFAFTCLMGLAVKPILDHLRKRIPVPAISENQELQDWWEQLQEHPIPSGSWIGFFERIIFFFALYVDRWELAGVWLAFKVASKWEAWNHMGFVPDEPGGRDNPVAPLKWAHARRVWAAQGYATFVVGTAANLILAAVGAWITNFQPTLN